MITKRLLFSFLLGCTVAASQSVQARTINGIALPAAQQQLHFIENKGQITDQAGNHRSDIQFRIAGKGVNVFIGDGQVHYQWAKKEKESVETYRMDVKLVGANTHASLVTEDKQSYTEHYYLPSTGNSATIANTYNKVTYKNVYPNIDWVLYIKDNKLEYDFVVRPGGKVSDIKLQYAGATVLAENAGDIIATTPMGTVRNHAPYSFQAANGQKINSAFALKNNVVSFDAGSYTGTLVIDPVVEWATYYGGADYDGINGIASDIYGAVYIVGATASTGNIATTGSHQATIGGGGENGYLAKFNGKGARIWATYYGGNNGAAIASVACDLKGHVYIAGQTTSTTNIATSGSHQPVFGGGTGLGDGYVVKFDSSGTRLWGTYYGSSRGDMVASVTCDSFDNIYICGSTAGTDNISTPGSHQPVKGNNPGTSNAFLAKITGAGTRIWGTYYGDTSAQALTVLVDKYGAVYITGSTHSISAIATPGAYQVTKAGTKNSTDDFLAKFDSSGRRIWGTYYGGSASEKDALATGISFGRFIASDDSGNVYLVSTTASNSNIATPGSYQATKAISQPAPEAYLVKFDSGGVRKWATYYSGTNAGFGTSICTVNNSIMIAGMTASTTGIATAGAHQSVFGGGADGFLAQFDNNGQRLWGTYYGDSGTQLNPLVVPDKEGNIYFGGSTDSAAGIATTGSYQPAYGGGGQDGFLVKFCVYAVNPSAPHGDDTICANTAHTYSVDAWENATYIWELPQGWTGTSTSNTITATSTDTGGAISVKAIKCGDTSDVAATFNVYVRPIIPASISVNGFTLSTTNTHSSYQWYLDGQPISGATNPTYEVKANGVYTVKVTNPGGCTDSSAAHNVTNYVSVANVANLSREITMYPNPATTYVHITSPVPVGISINSIDGKTVLHKATVAGGVDISGISQGIYLVRIISEDGKVIRVEKLIKSAR